MHDAQLDLATGDVVCIIDQHKVVSLLGCRVRKILRIGGNIGPGCSIIIILLQLDVMRRVAVIPRFKIDFQVSLWDGIILTESKIINKSGRGV